MDADAVPFACRPEEAGGMRRRLLNRTPSRRRMKTGQLTCYNSGQSSCALCGNGDKLTVPGSIKMDAF
jgi:hypothetical protein